MKVLKRKFLGVLMALFMAFCCVFAGWSGLPAIGVKAETTVVNLTYKSMQFQNNTENAGSYWTSVCFYPSVGDGVSSGNASGAIAADFSDLLAKTTYSGSDNSIIYSAACHWGWATDTKSSTFSFIYLRTVNAPALDDTIQMKSGAWFVTGGNIDDKYVLAEDINLKFNGTAWEYYVPVVDNTQWVTEFTNDGQFVVSNYGGDAINHPYEIIDGETAGLPAGYTGAVAKIGSKINAGAAYINVDFTASQIAAAQVESVVARVYLPGYEAEDFLRINNATGSIPAYNLSTWCDVELPLATITGADGNLGSFAFGLRDKGTVVSDYFYIDSITVNMVKPVVPVPVTFTNINSSWNNNSETLGNGMHYTILHLDGLLTSGYYTQGDDWSEMKANATINGGESYFNFCPASFIAGPNVEANFIVMYSATSPTTGDEFFVPAGTTFKVGGDDTNVYKLASDISLTFNGTAWAEPVKVSYSVYECVDPEILHTYSTTQNEDGSFTYTLPEYTRENKVLLGYVENRMVGETLVQTFIPSGKYTTDATGLTFIALWGEFTTIDGASIRISSAETSGIRWTTTIDAEGFNNIAYWATACQFGTELSADGFSENFDIVANKWKVENSTYTGVLIDITSNYYDVEFTARGYVDITYHNGVTKRIYAQANDTTRSIRQVAELAIESGDYSGSQLAVLQEIANA